MGNIKKSGLLLVLLWTFFLPSAAVSALSPETTVSLLTCTAGEELYSKFGHTAIRITDPEQQMDVVFNYGIFDSSIDHFYYRFAKGETDYQLGISSYSSFMWSYHMEGRSVFEQILNLDSVAKEAIYNALLVNYRPENRKYRYNFVFDNCATRPYYMIKENVDGALINMPFLERKDTYRQIIAHYTHPDSWSFCGIDLIFGTDADQLMTYEQRMFLPEELMEFLAAAQIVKGDAVKPAVVSQRIGAFVPPHASLFTSPRAVMLVLVFLFALLSLYQTQKQHYTFWADALFYLLLGVLGTIATYLAAFSEHPMVHNNYNILFINPVFFCLAILTLFPAGRRILGKCQWFLLLYAVVALVVRYSVPQQANWFINCVALILVLRSWTYLRIKKGKSLFPIVRRRAMLFLLLLSVGTLSAQQPPRLALYIVVDGLQEQNLQSLKTYFDTGGFRTLQKEATTYGNVIFPHLTSGGCETVATFSTGTIPANHGIPSNAYFDRKSAKVHPILEDVAEQGIGTSLQISPRNLLSASFTDMLKVAYGNEAKIFSIGIDPVATVIMGGHAADAAVWIDSENRRWASSTYYETGLPVQADQMNMDSTFLRIASREWLPRFSSIGLYLHPSEQERKNNGFSYVAYGTGSDIKNTADLSLMPNANELVAQLAMRIQEQQDLGEDLIPDVLCLQFTLRTPAAQSDLIQTAEQEDMHMRLNETLGKLLDFCVQKVGKEHLAVVLVGRPIAGLQPDDLSKARIPTGSFSVDRAAALTNAYLMALYGTERWVDGYYGNQLYLNRLLIEQRMLDLNRIQRQVADFLLEFEGVKSAYTSREIPLLTSTRFGDVSAINHSYHKRIGGDVAFGLLPGWRPVDENGQPYDYIFDPSPSVPVFLWGQGWGNDFYSYPVYATQLAPRLCEWLQIPFFGPVNIETRM